jgi:hypothetical protein
MAERGVEGKREEEGRRGGEISSMVSTRSTAQHSTAQRRQHIKY